MLFFCTSAIMTIIDYKPSMLMSCTFVVLIKFDYNPSMATSSIAIMLFTLFVKLFELELNLSRKRWNAIKFASFREDMVRKLICNKEEL